MWYPFDLTNIIMHILSSFKQNKFNKKSKLLKIYLQAKFPKQRATIAANKMITKGRAAWKRRPHGSMK
jgi:hypothetical protein